MSIFKKKLKIKPASDVGKPIYSHLNPIVDYLESKGYETLTPRWQPTPDGWFCRVYGVIDYSDIYEHFELPSSISGSETHNQLDCMGSRCVIFSLGYKKT